jgi:hypothetical protein
MNLLDIINATVPTVYVMWLEGSWATGKNNEHSGIDVWLDVAILKHWNRCNSQLKTKQSIAALIPYE